MIFPDFTSLFKIPWLFSDWKMPSHFSRFSSPSGNPDVYPFHNYLVNDIGVRLTRLQVLDHRFVTFPGWYVQWCVAFVLKHRKHLFWKNYRSYIHGRIPLKVWRGGEEPTLNFYISSKSSHTPVKLKKCWSVRATQTFSLWIHNRYLWLFVRQQYWTEQSIWKQVDSLLWTKKRERKHVFNLKLNPSICIEIWYHLLVTTLCCIKISNII